MNARSLLAATAVAAVLTGGLVGVATAAEAAGSTGSTGQCPDAAPVPGNADSLTVSAPTGKVITGYCVKAAGRRGLSAPPETVVLATPVTSIVLRHTEGGNLTHYSLFLAPAPGVVPPVTEPPVTEPPVTEPPVTEPPVTEPPVTEPPVTEPPVTEPPAEEPPVDEPEVEEPESTPNPPATTPSGGFDWDWTYETPGCDGLVVAYPVNIPDGQSNDVNIRLETDRGEVTLNYHLDQGTWSGTTAFVYSQHRLWPEGVSEYAVTWTQVGGTNYHWQGRVECALGEVSPETGTRNGYLRTALSTGDEESAPVVSGFRSGSTTVGRGQRVGNDLVSVSGLGDRVLDLQRLTKGAWTRVSTVATADGTAVVAYPKQNKRGTFSYRLVSGDFTSGVLTVTVR